MKIVDKPWGEEIWIAHTNGLYAGKILKVYAGKRLSKQYHKKKHETMYILQGEVDIELNNKIKTYKSNDIIEIPPGTNHRVQAITNTIIIEFSSPELDDVIRLDDDFGRVKK